MARSALKHGCSREDVSHAYDMWQYEGSLNDADTKILTIGPDPAGNLLELVGCPLEDGDHLVFHAMTCRKSYLDLLNDQRRRV